jgi:hypothetical protein
MAMTAAPWYPIIYIRGYAGTQGEVEETVADPYMGFNRGSTKLRQQWDRSVIRHVFESPLVRLMKDYGYSDAYADGAELTGRETIPWRTVWIYRYYEEVSGELGSGKRPEIEQYAEGLGNFLRDIRDRICGDSQRARDGFRVYLVAHSMGGLVARCWLQNTRLREEDPVVAEKLFTYATPHRGIDLRLIGNIPRFVQINNTENFNQERMRKYLRISSKKVPVHSLDGKFPPERCFSLVGTNARDYEVAGGLSRAAVGPMSDGLVQIRNAYIDDAPRAFVHRAHSGHFGVVNSEEGYQNLRRFFFGDLRVDGQLEVEAITLPRKVQRAKDRGSEVRASYHIEVCANVRDTRWYLHRRTLDEGSAIIAGYDAMVKARKPVKLFTQFLSSAAIVTRSSYMGFSVDLGVLVPEYSVGGRLLFEDHFEGSYIFRDKLNMFVKAEDGRLRVKHGWDRERTNAAGETVTLEETDGRWSLTVPVEKETAPGIRAKLRLTFSA